jgi:hypothetical protein
VTPTPSPTPAPTPGSFGKASPKNNAKVAVGAVTLSWAASANATGYEYCVSTKANTCTSWTSTGTARTVTVAAPLGRTTSYWQVRAVGGGAWTYANNGSWWRFSTR